MPPAFQPPIFSTVKVRSLEQLAREFNQLPRPQTISNGKPNHWVFGTRPLGYGGQANTMVLLHTYTAECVQVMPDSKDLTKAEDLVSSLLEACLAPNASTTYTPVLGAAAPYSWAMDDPSMAAAVSAVLQKYGVTGALATVGTASKTEIRIFDATWTERMEGMKNLMKLSGKPLASELPMSTAKLSVLNAELSALSLSKDPNALLLRPMVQCATDVVLTQLCQVT